MKKIIATAIAFLFASAPAFAGSYGFPQKNENSAFTTADPTMVLGGVRVDANDTARSTSGNYATLTTNDMGNLKVQVEGNRKPTYSCTTGQFATIASATDMAELYWGSKTIKVLKVMVSYKNAAANAVNDFFLIKRSGANTSGTPTTPGVVKHDSNSGAATGVVKYYPSGGANPTTGATAAGFGTVAVMSSNPVDTLTSAQTNCNPIVLFEATPYTQPITLRASGEGLVVNNGGVTLQGTTPLISVTYIWTEE